MTIAYVEPFAGIAGDMTVAALLDLGYPLEALEESLARLPVGGYRIAAERAMRGGFTGTRFLVEADESHPHRKLGDVRAILDAGSLPDRVLARANGAFDRLAAAEAGVHGKDVEEIHFHEVGAVDAIVDVVGAALGFEHFDVDRIVCSRVRVGTGEVDCAHGTIPVPAPGALALLEGLPILLAEGEGETTTPTGAAVLAAWAEPASGAMPFRVARTGYGAGAREDTKLANLLRISLGDEGDDRTADRVVKLEANLDDQSPETLAHAVLRLFEEGALDVWLTPVLMKKGRPGQVLTVLAEEADAARFEAAIFRETTTFGVRRSRHERAKLVRRHVEVVTEFGTVRVKVGTHLGEDVTLAPEHEDCARLARKRGVPLREVYAAAIRELPGH